MKRIYRESPGGQVLELANPGARGAQDVHVFRPLSGLQRRRFRSLRAKGASDSGIWRALHGAEPCRDQARLASVGTRRTLDLSLDGFSKAQLVALARSFSEAPLVGLERLPKATLRELIRGLAKGSRIMLTLT